MIKIFKGLQFNSIKLIVPFITIIASGFFLVTDISFSRSVTQPIIREQAFVPAVILKWPNNCFDHIVLVDKADQKIMVYSEGDLSEPVQVYTCSTGENDGPKTKKNDRKTPEGIYFFTKSFVDRELTPIYGIRAFPINYPNAIDKMEGKGGYGIWFHGTNKPLKPKDTNGCIVLENGNIDDLAKYIKLNSTPVIISKKIEMVSQKELGSEVEELVKLVENWRRSWEEKDINEYISFYHDKFYSGNRNRKQWKEHKARLAKLYREIDIEIEGLQLLRNDELLMARFQQNYRASGHISHGIKTLYFKKNSNEWKIVGEYFSQSKDKVVLVKKKTPSIEKQINDLIESWRIAWEGKDLEKYIGFYDKRFRSRGMSRNSWMNHRKRLNDKYEVLKIQITDIKIVHQSGSTVRVKFKQQYRADSYKDFGIKELLFIKEGKNWKIRKEDWRPVSG
jgi:murein L,D-transpeptidase YafK